MLIDGEEVIYRKENREYELFLDLVDDGPSLFMLCATSTKDPNEYMQIPLTLMDLRQMYLGAIEHSLEQAKKRS